MTRQVRGQIRTALGGGKQSTADVWETATSDYDESPECAWCPICRARRRLRESGPGLSSGVAAAADAVGVVMQDAMSAFEAAVAAAGRQTRPRDTTVPPPDEVWDEATDEPAVRTRPPANGGPARPTAAKPPSSTGPKRSSTGPRKPSAGPKKPPARPTGSASDTSASQPNSDKPSSDKPTPDEPAS